MRDVTKVDFWRWVLTTPRNVHPRPEPMETLWIDQRTHEVVGVSTPGYRCEGPESFRIEEGR